MFDTSYPLPEDAVAVSIRADSRLQLYMPGVNSSGHSIVITPDEVGMKVLVKILRERLKSPGQNTISSRMNAPTQSIVDAWLRANAAPAPKKEKESNIPKLDSIDMDELFEGLI